MDFLPYSTGEHLQFTECLVWHYDKQLAFIILFNSHNQLVLSSFYFIRKLIFKEMNDLPKVTNLGSKRFGILPKTFRIKRLCFTSSMNVYAKNIFLIYLFAQLTFTDYLPNADKCSRYWFFFFWDKGLPLLHLGDLLLNLLK